MTPDYDDTETTETTTVEASFPLIPMDQQIRLDCLSYACDLARGGWFTPDKIVENAQAFEKFVVGE